MTLPVKDPFEKCPTLPQFMEAVAQEERARHFLATEAGRLHLDPQANLGLRGSADCYPMSKGATLDLAREARIPAPFFARLPPDLKAMVFNRLSRDRIPPESPATVTLVDRTAARVRFGKLLANLRAPMLDAVADATPAGIDVSTLRVCVFRNNGALDIAIIQPALNTQCLPGDLIAGGIALIEDGVDGSAQIMSATLRTICTNGAYVRVCSSSSTRLRRPHLESRRQEAFFQGIRRLAIEAWQQWPENSRGLAALAHTRLSDGELERMVLRLREAPFSLPARLSRSIAERTREEAMATGGELTLYAIWNAMTWIAQDRELDWSYQRLLRLGAGALARRGSRVCSECQQLVLA